MYKNLFKSWRERKISRFILSNTIFHRIDSIHVSNYEATFRQLRAENRIDVFIARGMRKEDEDKIGVFSIKKYIEGGLRAGRGWGIRSYWTSRTCPWNDRYNCAPQPRIRYLDCGKGRIWNLFRGDGRNLDGAMGLGFDEGRS